MQTSIPFWKKILLWTPGEQRRYRRYALTIISHVLVIWIPVIIYLQVTPYSYTSQWSLMLPGPGYSSSVSLRSVGQASTSSKPAWGSSSLSPKVNYKTMSESEVLMKEAANSMGMDVGEYGEPMITLIDETAIMLFKITATSPDVAQKKGFAHYNILQKKLDELRRDEQTVREENIREMLKTYNENLSNTGQAVLQLQAETELISTNQFEQLVTTIQSMRWNLIELKAEQQRVHSEELQLEQTLGLSAQQASSALILQTDKIFQKLSDEYANLTVIYHQNTSIWGDNHPEVVNAYEKKSRLFEKLNIRFQQLLNHEDSWLVELLSLSADSVRGSLLETLINNNIKKTGLTNKISTLQFEIQNLEQTLEKQTKNAAELENLKRNHQIAEAVFVSALARVDTEKSDLYASYPLLQMYEKPSLPGEPSSPKKKLVYVGAGIASILVTTALILLWIRKPYLRKILLNE